MKLLNLKCTNCSATLEIEEGAKKLTCKYCGANLILDDEKIVIENVSSKLTNSLLEIEEYYDNGNYEKSYDLALNLHNEYPKNAEIKNFIIKSAIKITNSYSKIGNYNSIKNVAKKMLELDYENEEVKECVNNLLNSLFDKKDYNSILEYSRYILEEIDENHELAKKGYRIYWEYHLPIAYEEHKKELFTKNVNKTIEDCNALLGYYPDSTIIQEVKEKCEQQLLKIKKNDKKEKNIKIIKIIIIELIIISIFAAGIILFAMALKPGQDGLGQAALLLIVVAIIAEVKYIKHLKNN